MVLLVAQPRRYGIRYNVQQQGALLCFVSPDHAPGNDFLFHIMDHRIENQELVVPDHDLKIRTQGLRLLLIPVIYLYGLFVIKYGRPLLRGNGLRA